MREKKETQLGEGNSEEEKCVVDQSESGKSAWKKVSKILPWKEKSTLVKLCISP